MVVVDFGCYRALVVDIVVGILAGGIVGIAVGAFGVDYTQVGQGVDRRGVGHIVVADIADQHTVLLLV